MGERVSVRGAGGDVDKPLRHFFGRAVGVAREDELVELARLIGDGRRDPGMAMAVGRHPPTGDAVDERAAVRQMQQGPLRRSEEHTSELQPLMRISYAVFCLKKKKNKTYHT